LMETVKVASLGQITDALFKVGGQYRRNMWFYASFLILLLHQKENGSLSSERLLNSLVIALSKTSTVSILIWLST
jgi:hypothetical protein